jgi:hypothetical protein
VAWQPTGKLAATQCKDRRLRIVDPRVAQVSILCSSKKSAKKFANFFYLDKVLPNQYKQALIQLLQTCVNLAFNRCKK